MKTIVIRHADQKCEVVIGIGVTGAFCKTHKKAVSRFSRCPNFNANTAMWTDLWNNAMGYRTGRR